MSQWPTPTWQYKINQEAPKYGGLENQNYQHTPAMMGGQTSPSGTGENSASSGSRAGTSNHLTPYQYMQYPVQQMPMMGSEYVQPGGASLSGPELWELSLAGTRGQQPQLGPSAPAQPHLSLAGLEPHSPLLLSDDKALPRRDSGHAGSADDQTSSSTSVSSGENLSKLGSLLGLKVTKRSRMGCLTCRQRKKRCCETRPRCTECLRLKLNCIWPRPGTEHKNKSKEVKSQENTIDHDVYGKIKVLRGIVEYRLN